MDLQLVKYTGFLNLPSDLWKRTLREWGPGICILMSSSLWFWCWLHPAQKNVHIVDAKFKKSMLSKAWPCIWQREEISNGYKKEVWKNMSTVDSFHSGWGGKSWIAVICLAWALGIEDVFPCHLKKQEGSLKANILERESRISGWKAILKRDFWPWQLAEDKALWESSFGVGTWGSNGRGVQIPAWGHQNPSLSVSVTCNLDLYARPLWLIAMMAPILHPSLCPRPWPCDCSAPPPWLSLTMWLALNNGILAHTYSHNSGTLYPHQTL